MSGWLAVAGLGPGDAALVTPEVTAALAQASDVVGYAPYVARVAARTGRPHAAVHSQVRRAVPGPASSAADPDLLSARRDHLLGLL